MTRKLPEPTTETSIYLAAVLEELQQLNKILSAKLQPKPVELPKGLTHKEASKQK